MLRTPMLLKRIAAVLACFVAFVCITSVSTAGQLWDFLGLTQIDDSRDHGKIQVTRRDRLFSAIQLRVSGDSIFFDRVVVHFPNGTSEEVSVGNRVSPEGRNYLIQLSGERRGVESVDLWYYRQTWTHHPRVILYGW